MAVALEHPYPHYQPYIFIARVVNAIISIIELMLGLRLTLQFLGANPVSQFVAWTYSITDTLIGPFAGAFPALTIGGFVVDVSTIFAMIGYVVIGWLIMQVLAFVFSIP